MQAWEDELHVSLIQGWGMTETSPVAAMALPLPGATTDEAWHSRDSAGRTLFGVEARICSDSGQPLPHDGEGIGECEVRDPWVTGLYYRNDTENAAHNADDVHRSQLSARCGPVRPGVATSGASRHTENGRRSGAACSSGQGSPPRLRDHRRLGAVTRCEDG